VQTVLEHLEEGWWEQVILLAGAHPKTPDDVRENLVCSLLELVDQQPRGSERWIRALKMAGWQALDMAGHLAGSALDAVEQALHQQMVDPDLEPKLRAELADVLDALWLPPDLDRFVPVPDAENLSFWIGKYPVTNVQYERFLNAPDYGEKRYWVDFPKYDEESRLMEGQAWGDEGWLWLGERLKDHGSSPDGRRLLPLYWNDPRFGIPRRGVPVLGVRWYEANAYCKWLLAHWHDPALGLVEANPGVSPTTIRLPTEAEWVKTAGGEKATVGGKQNDRYPWDVEGEVTIQEEEIVKRANIDESGIGRTSPVGMYPLGASPCGACDLAGNVWEWQANYTGKNLNWLALRGGSWYNYLRSARVAARSNARPGSRNSNLGFRVCLLQWVVVPQKKM
jgi:formylglycine-generating enzyme required for sulfatase activity